MEWTSGAWNGDLDQHLARLKADLLKGVYRPKSWPRRPLGALLAILAIGGSWNDGCDGAATGMGDGGGAACGGIGIP
jgi:hypothetical protein